MKTPRSTRCKGAICDSIQSPLPSGRRSSRLTGARADIVCLPNYKSDLEVVWKSTKDTHSDEFSEVLLCSSPESKRKSPEVPPPEQPHSAPSGGPRPYSSPELDDGFEASTYPYRHDTRAPNSKDDFGRSKNQRLNLPATHDKKAWLELDAILSDVLPRRFSSSRIRSTPTARLAADFDELIYNFFKENCGLVEPPIVAPPNSGEAKHKGLERLRRKKQLCKRSIKHLRKIGPDDSVAVQALQKLWKKLMKAHNRLRVAVKHKRHARGKKFAKRQFAKDPTKFAKKLFSGQRKSGTQRLTRNRPSPTSANSTTTRSANTTTPLLRA